MEHPSNSERPTRIHVELTESDYQAVQRLVARPRRVQTFIALTSTALMMSGGISALVSATAPPQIKLAGTTLIGVVAGFWLMLPAIYFVILPRRMRTLVRQQAPADAAFDILWDSKGIVCYTARGTQSLDWSQFARWKEDSDSYLLYRSDATMWFIPKRCFLDSGVEADFSDRLHSRIGRPAF